MTRFFAIWFGALLVVIGLLTLQPSVPTITHVHAQPLPNCFLNGSLTATGTSPVLDNSLSQNQCNSWVLNVFVPSTVSAFSVQLEGSAAGTFTPVVITPLTGTNPCTSLTGCLMVFQTSYNQFRVNLTVLTGSGTVSYRLTGASGITAKIPSTPSGVAGGDLTGTYPNPTVAQVQNAVIPLSALTVSTNASRQLIAGPTNVTVNGTACTLGGSCTIATGASPQFSQTNTVTVSGVVVETSLVGTGSGTPTLPANFFANAGSILRVNVEMFFTGTVNAAVFKTKLGGTQINAGAVTPAGNNYTCHFDYIITARTVGAAGTVIANGLIDCFNLTSPGNLDVGFNSLSTPVTINTTGTLAFDFTVTPGATGQSFSNTNLTLSNY